MGRISQRMGGRANMRQDNMINSYLGVGWCLMVHDHKLGFPTNKPPPLEPDVKRGVAHL